MTGTEDAMNYCPTCRRHLNGALSCPGCGAQAAELPQAMPEEQPASRTVAYEQPGAGRPQSRRRKEPRRGRGLLIGGLSTVVLAAAGIAVAVSTPASVGVPTGSGVVADGSGATATDSATPVPESSGVARAGKAHRSHPAKPRSASASPSPTDKSTSKSGTSAGTGAGTSAKPSTATGGTGTSGGSTGGGASSPSARPSASATCHQVLFWCG
ncbi:hypothetical protein ABIA32_002566 [Streptacidiphilus sp. MAP12-20]|uniref:hypothetical protein n=1 Tax=Streptacidiphilus sp. MAP12-20 TaxID=3156299 RepID=UPI0035151373